MARKLRVKRPGDPNPVLSYGRGPDGSARRLGLADGILPTYRRSSAGATVGDVPARAERARGARVSK